MKANVSGAELPSLPAWKRMVDIACCFIAFPVLGLVALAAALTVKMTSPGPILFRQERVGHLGRRFSLYKFRTMRLSADTSVHQTHFLQQMKSSTPMQKLDAR